MYTIKWVAEHLGVPTGTLRAWEQRYDIVHPARTEAGYRIYSDADLATLTAMTRLVETGIQPAQAAEQIRHRPRALTVQPHRPDEAPPGLPSPHALIAASRTYDVEALENILDTAFSQAGFEYVIDHWLTTAMTDVGEAWARGDLDISHEHVISAAVMRRLSAAFDAAGHAPLGMHILTGLAPGATHEIATLAFATMLRRAGLQVTYLGPDLPAASWVEAARTTRPDAVVIAAPRKADTPAATHVTQALHQATPQTPLYIGGPDTPPEHTLQGPTLTHMRDSLIAALNRR